jgi:hypothetical protein
MALLLHKRSWPTSLRKDSDDRRDSEARLIPLNDGRFIACTNATLALYNTNFELQKEKKLEPSGPSDFWSMQRAGDSELIFLRHESRSERSVMFSWLDASTLEVISQLPKKPWIYEYKGMFMQGTGVNGSIGSVFGAGSEGLRMIDSDQQFKTVCGDPVCREQKRGWQMFPESK